MMTTKTPAGAARLRPLVVAAGALALLSCREEKRAPDSRDAPAGSAVLRCEAFAAPLLPQMEIQRGRTLPLKAQLLDAAGQPVTGEKLDPAPEVRLVRLEGGAATDRSELAAAGDFGKSGRFVFRESYWKFDLATADFPEPGTYRAEIASGDESRYRIEPACAITFVLK